MVRSEMRAGVHHLRYVGYLGEQRNETATAGMTVAWFFFTAESRERHRAAEGLTSSQWVAWDDVADAKLLDDRVPHLRRAHDLISWRRAAGLPYSSVLGELVARCSQVASELLSGLDGAGLGLCGSAARGDFIDDWSDVDLLGWGLKAASPAAQRLENLAAGLGEEYGVHVSLDLADGNGQDIVDADPLFTPKLQGLFLRSGVEVPVLAGCPPPVPSMLCLSDRIDESLDRLERFARRHLASAAASTSQQRAERARRVLSVACHAARSVATVIDPQLPSDLRLVAPLLAEHLPANQLSRLLDDYRRFRQDGAADVSTADDLATRVPDALLDVRRMITSAGIVRNG